MRWETTFGFSTAILDDLLDADGALSDSTRNAAHTWFQNTLQTRANDPSSAAIFSISQRLHEDDVTGHLLAAEPGIWRHVSIPLRADEPAEYVFPDGRTTWKRPTGAVLMPKRFPPQVVTELETRRLVWASQYQQSPLCLDGNMVRLSDLRYHSGIDPQTGEADESLLADFDYKLITVDAAFKNYSDSDYTAVIAIGVKGPKKFVLDVVNSHLTVDGMEQAIRRMIEKMGTDQGDAHRIGGFRHCGRATFEGELLHSRHRSAAPGRQGCQVRRGIARVSGSSMAVGP